MGFSAPVKGKDVNSINAQRCRLQTKRARQKRRAGRVSVFVQLKKRFDITMCKQKLWVIMSHLSIILRIGLIEMSRSSCVDINEV